MKRIGIIGTGSYLPQKVMTNFDISQFLDTSDEWIYTRTGIRERRIAEKGVGVSELCKVASERAMESAGVKPSDIDLIILGTITPDTHCPAGANWLEAKLGCQKAVSFDITAACSGFIFALHVADKMIRSGANKTALVVAGEIMSRTVKLGGTGELYSLGRRRRGSSHHRNGARRRARLNQYSHRRCRRRHTTHAGGRSLTTPISHESVDKRLHVLRMINANQSIRPAIDHFSEAAMQAAASGGMSITDIDVFIPHQANIRIIEGVSKRLKIPMEKVYLTIEKYGNMSSATVPVALDEAVRDGTITKGKSVVLCAFGGGLTWGGSLLRW